MFPACPKGTVWRNRQCLPAGYVITKLLIENVVRNNLEYRTSTETVYYGENQHAEIIDDTTLVPPPSALLPTTAPPNEILNMTELPPNAGSDENCCLVISPRICRPFPPTWACFSRSKTFCDSRICTKNIKQVYLKPSGIVELQNPYRLIMPPNPPLKACQTANCDESGKLSSLKIVYYLVFYINLFYTSRLNQLLWLCGGQEGRMFYQLL